VKEAYRKLAQCGPQCCRGKFIEMLNVKKLGTFILLVYFVAVCRGNPFIAHLESCEIFSSSSKTNTVFVFHCGSSATVNCCKKSVRFWSREVLHTSGCWRLIINVEGVVREEYEIVCCTGELRHIYGDHW